MLRRAARALSSSSRRRDSHGRVEFSRVVDASADEAKAGGMSLLELSMSHVGRAQTQQDLVAELVQNGVLKSELLRKPMAALDRALFVPVQQDAAVYAEPYANAPQKLHAASGATLSTPHHHCVVGEAMVEFLQFVHQEEKPVRCLDVGCGTGYLTVLLAEVMQDLGLLVDGPADSPQVVGTDAVPALVAHAHEKAASRCTSELAARSLVFVDAFDAEGRPVLDAASSDGVSGAMGFDLVHAGFAFDLESPLGLALVHEALRPGGRLVASLALSDGAQELVTIDKSLSGKQLTKTILARNMHCQAQIDATFDEVAASKSRADLLEEVRRDLDAWKADFESTHARKPSRDDMMSDAQAAALFKRFAALRQGSWDK